jgi:ADP-heptose:LPS heptosyltransferase
MKRILLVKTSSLGDVIHCLPVINDIRAHYPDVEIDWVVEEGFADIPRMHPHVNQVVSGGDAALEKIIFSFKNLVRDFCIQKNDSSNINTMQ